MLYNLETPERRAAVVAHELAHLKQGHYYSKLGLAILANALVITGELYMPYSSQVTNPLGSMGLAAFSRSHESEADRLAVQYLRKANYKKEDFLDLLYWMEDTLPDHAFDPLLRTHPHVTERIKDIEALPDDPEPVYIVASHN
jgi:predicted Zn-dependent protease